MSYMVNFRSSEGKPGYHPTDTLEEAVRFVEHLRNQEQVDDARVWRLQEVPLEVKTYYKVEVVTAAPDTGPARADTGPARADDDAAQADPVGASVGADGAGVGSNAAARFGRFNRS